MQITNEIFAHRKKSPFVISSATRKPSKAVAVNFGETIRLTGLARLSLSTRGWKYIFEARFTRIQGLSNDGRFIFNC